MIRLLLPFVIFLPAFAQINATAPPRTLVQRSADIETLAVRLKATETAAFDSPCSSLLRGFDELQQIRAQWAQAARFEIETVLSDSSQLSLFGDQSSVNQRASRIVLSILQTAPDRENAVELLNQRSVLPANRLQSFRDVVKRLRSDSWNVLLSIALDAGLYLPTNITTRDNSLSSLIDDLMDFDDSLKKCYEDGESDIRERCSERITAPPAPPPSSGLGTVRGFLAKGQTELPGYGFYSYLLFTQHYDRYSEEQYLAVIGAYLLNIA